MMMTQVYKDYKELSLQTARQIAQLIAEKPEALLCFPSGETSVGTFEELAAMQRERRIDFSRCRFVGLDEWMGLGAMKKENCLHFMRKHLFDSIGVEPANLCFFDGEARDLKKECAAADAFIARRGAIDLMLLGIGMNGHLGMNEPGTPFDTYSHTVELDEVTKTVAQKYFSAPVRLSQGVTLGLRHVMESRTVILQASGQKKSSIIRRLIETEATPALPASIIKEHPNAYLLMDAEASPSTP